MDHALRIHNENQANIKRIKELEAKDIPDVMLKRLINYAYRSDGNTLLLKTCEDAKVILAKRERW